MSNASLNKRSLFKVEGLDQPEDQPERKGVMMWTLGETEGAGFVSAQSHRQKLKDGEVG